MPRAGNEPTSLALQASVRTISTDRLPDVIYLSMQLLACEVNAAADYTPPAGIVNIVILTITYIQA